MGSSECRLLKGNVALAAQLSLAACIASSLLFKRHRERPRRPLNIWLLDVSKQGFSATACHIINTTFAVAASRRVQDGDIEEGASECSWYFVQYNFDNTMGVTLTILLHQAIVALAKWYVQRSLFKDSSDQLSLVEIIALCGNYGTPPRIFRWFIQVVEWLFAVVVARSITGGFVILLSSVLLNPLAEFVDDLFDGQSILHLYFILVVYPMFCSTTVAWILDGLLKRKQETNQPMIVQEESEPLICVLVSDV